MTTNTDAAPSQTLDEQAATLQRVYDLVGMGALARTPGILLANLENMKRRSDCLSGIELLFTYEVPDEQDEWEMVEECDLNWGHARAEYVEAFKAALPAFIARNPELGSVEAQAEAMRIGPFTRLVALHSQQLDSNPHCYFELAYTRTTGWMAWITDRPAQGEPGTAEYAKSRKVIVRGQADTAIEACADALAALAATASSAEGQ
ncbi:MAG TPA: hypothetical protein VF534_04370 [Paraburkholderia sp.]